MLFLPLFFDNIFRHYVLTAEMWDNEILVSLKLTVGLIGAAGWVTVAGSSSVPPESGTGNQTDSPKS